MKKQLSLMIFSSFVLFGLLLSSTSAYAASATADGVRKTEGSNVTAENCSDERCAAAFNNNPCNTPQRDCQKEAAARLLEVFGESPDGTPASGQKGNK